MTDIRKKLSDDEYQFPAEEYQAADHASVTENDELLAENSEAAIQPATTQSPFEFIKNIQWGQHKRVLIVIGVSLLALLLFKIFKPSHEVVKSEINPQTTVNAQLQDQINTLKQNAVTNQNNLMALNAQLQDLKQSVNQASAVQAQTTQVLSSIADQVKQLSEEMKTLTAKKPVKPEFSGPPIVYHLTAVVPGRAWIQTAEGQNDTVSVGDNVPQYGTVETIDSDAGIITTSSGKTIRYGSRDS